MKPLPHALAEDEASEGIVWLWNDPEEPERWWVRSNASSRTATQRDDVARLLEAVRSLAGPGSRVFAEAGGSAGFEASELRSAGFEPGEPSEPTPPNRA